MRAAFTKGPWEARDTCSQQERWVVAADHPYSTDHKLSVAREIDAEADARLIAAAPELYEALTDIRNRVLCPVGPTPTLDELQEIASAALAKARGDA